MAVAAHRNALRAGISGYFRMITRDVKQAPRTRRIADDLKEASDSLLSELVSEWQFANTSIYRLPEEVLAMCFVLLPFADRITASHVSQYWRYVSLSHPAIWAHVELEEWFRDKAALFKMALDRTGNHPVDVLNCPHFDPDGRVEESLVVHMHHIRTFYYPAVFPLLFMYAPAPLLEVMRGGGEHLRIGRGLLGGKAARLRSLHAQIVSFPASCPALSTVTNLVIHAPATAQDATHFGQLFQLCPALESFSLLHMTGLISPFVPVGPAPRSLRYVLLGSGDQEYDLTVYCVAWRLDGLRDIVIYQGAEAAGDLVHLVSGAVMVDIRREPDSSTTAITALGPGLRRREIEFLEEDDDQHVLAAQMLGFQAALTGLCAMTLPAASLAQFLAVFAVLPAITRLEITIPDEDDGAGGHVFDWHLLDSLARLPEPRPELQSVILNVVRPRSDYPPYAYDAHDLVAQLSRYAHVVLPTIFVKGFTAEALIGLHMPEFVGFQCIFIPRD